LAFSEQAYEEIRLMYSHIIKINNKAITAFKTTDFDLAREVMADDKKIDRLEKKLRVFRPPA
jgi:Na+/phosphate symporter